MRRLCTIVWSEPRIIVYLCLLCSMTPHTRFARAAEGVNESGVVVVDDFSKGADAWKPTDPRLGR